MIKVTALSFCALLIAAGMVGCTNPAVDITNRALDAHDSTAYNEYLKQTAEINLEREKAGLLPTPVMGRKEWAGKK